LSQLVESSKNYNVNSAIDILENTVEGYVQENKISR